MIKLLIPDERGVVSKLLHTYGTYQEIIIIITKVLAQLEETDKVEFEIRDFSRQEGKVLGDALQEQTEIRRSTLVQRHVSKIWYDRQEECTNKEALNTKTGDVFSWME